MRLPRQGRGRDSLTQRVAFFAFCLLGCGGSQAAAPDGSSLLALHGAPDDALVTIDSVARGTIARTGGAYLVEAGSRRLEIAAPGYLPYWLDVELVAGEAYDLELQLWPCFEDVDPDCVPTVEGMFEGLIGAPAEP